MNYIKLNGKRSTEIAGLLIQTLPPISKPLKRTNIEEIDGRDGDIITELGYSAYDKEIEIGLYSDFDINKIISYFDSEGIVTFSNEPDKLYKYKIIEQIDFERLLRFRKATVTFHVQPFKFSTLHEKQTFNVQNTQKIEIKNHGNIYSKPILKIYGSGTLNISLNEHQLFVITLGDDPTEITIDTEKMEAYHKHPLQLRNRLVDGNYDNFRLQVGINKIVWTGNITKIEIDNYSRWI